MATKRTSTRTSAKPFVWYLNKKRYAASELPTLQSVGGFPRDFMPRDVIEVKQSGKLVLSYRYCSWGGVLQIFPR